MSAARKTVLFPFLLLLVVLASVEAGARVLEAVQAWRGKDELSDQFIQSRNSAAVFERAVHRGVEHYRRTAHHWIPEKQSFALHKPPGGFRAFVIGSSAAMGWPHRGEHSIAGLLDRKLRLLYPSMPVEVLNTAGNTYASYRSRLVLEEVAGYAPDLMVIYSGNNEFLENLVYHPLAGAGLPGPLQRSALARLSFRAVRRILVRPVEIDVANYGERDMRSNRLSFAFGRASRLREDPDQLRAVRENYRNNVTSMIRTCKKRGIAVMVLRVPVNLKDWVPNASTHGKGLDSEALAAWQQSFREGFLALEAGDPARAVAALQDAVRRDEEHAESWFRLGRAYLALGRRAEAKAAFQQALMRDAYPFRFIFDDVLQEMCRQEGASVLDTVGALEATTADGILGLDALVDYVHPSVASNVVMTDRILSAAMEAGLLPRARLADAELPIGAEVEDDPTVLRALYGQFLVMRQYDHLPHIALRLRRSLDAAGDSKRLRGARAELDATESVVGPYARMLRAEKLGTLASEMSPAEAERIFDAYVDLVRRRESGDMTDEEFRNFVPSMGNVGR